jgi:hypothetical protein
MGAKRANRPSPLTNIAEQLGNRRFTRLTNAFSKKVENHEHMLALFFMYYNFCRIHQSLRVTPAMEAGICGHVWRLEEIVGLLAIEGSAEREVRWSPLVGQVDRVN